MKVSVQIPNTCSGAVAAVSAADETDLVVEAKDGLVDRRGSEQDMFLVLATDLAPPVICRQDALQVFVALGVAIAKPDFGGKGLQISTEWRMLMHGNASFPLMFSI